MSFILVGTSVSIEKGGFSSFLAQQIKSKESLVNLSVGNQTSITGLMRLLNFREQMMPGDKLIWEYPLLDILKTPSHFDLSSVLDAMCEAWALALAHSMQVVVAVTPPRDAIAEPGETEVKIVALAHAWHVPVVNFRDILLEMFSSEEARREAYRDDRHPRIGPALVEYARRVHAVVESTGSTSVSSGGSGREMVYKKKFEYLTGVDMAASCGLEIKEFANSLLNILAVKIAPNQYVNLPLKHQLVALGVISTPSSGAIWCGHQSCPPNSTTLSGSSRFPFIVRAMHLPCGRELTRVSARPDYIASLGVWAESAADAEANRESLIAPIFIFGMLLRASCSVTDANL